MFNKQLSTYVDTVHILVAVGTCTVLPVHTPPTNRGPATVLQCLSDGSEGAWGIPRIPLSASETESNQAGDIGKVAPGRAHVLFALIR